LGKTTGKNKVKTDLREVAAPPQNIMAIFVLGSNMMETATQAQNIMGFLH
jgi:hypothetical protein